MHLVASSHARICGNALRYASALSTFLRLPVCALMLLFPAVHPLSFWCVFIRGWLFSLVFSPFLCFLKTITAFNIPHCSACCTEHDEGNEHNEHNATPRVQRHATSTRLHHECNDTPRVQRYTTSTRLHHEYNDTPRVAEKSPSRYICPYKNKKIAPKMQCFTWNNPFFASKHEKADFYEKASTNHSKRASWRRFDTNNHL